MLFWHFNSLRKCHRDHDVVVVSKSNDWTD